jgi:hypothetical protein
MNSRIVTVTSLFAALLVIVFPGINLASFDSTRHEARSIWSATYDNCYVCVIAYTPLYLRSPYHI